MGKYSRVDGKKSSGYGLTITIVLAVSLCLVGAWMFMSSWSAPTEESVDFSSTQTPTDVDTTTTKTDFTNEEFDKVSKSEETEVVKESNEDKPDPESSGEEKKEFEDKNGEGDRKDGEGESESDETKQKEKTQLEESSEENKSEDGNGTEENNEENTEKKTEESAGETEENTEKSTGDQAEITKESSSGSGAWSTQLVESQNEKKAQVSSIKWKVCNVTAGPDYIPCLDNWLAIKKLHSTKHYEHRERHCPEESPTCLVSLPEGYKRSIKWPKSREKVKLIAPLRYVSMIPINSLCFVLTHRYGTTTFLTPSLHK